MQPRAGSVAGALTLLDDRGGDAKLRVFCVRKWAFLSGMALFPGAKLPEFRFKQDAQGIA